MLRINKRTYVRRFLNDYITKKVELEPELTCCSKWTLIYYFYYFLSFTWLTGQQNMVNIPVGLYL